MSHNRILLGAAAALFGVSSALAQVQPLAPSVPVVSQLPYSSPSDLIQEVPTTGYGVPAQYAQVGQVTGIQGYNNQGVLATGQTIAFTNTQWSIIAQSSATIAAVTLTAAPNPGDGQLNCYFNTQATTAITWNANSTLFTQNISGAPSAGTANTRYCMMWQKSSATWLRVQ